MYPPAVFDKLDKQFVIDVLEMFVYFAASVIEENVLITILSLSSCTIVVLIFLISFLLQTIYHPLELTPYLINLILLYLQSHYPKK